jgi:hypothetical protein
MNLGIPQPQAAYHDKLGVQMFIFRLGQVVLMMPSQCLRALEAELLWGKHNFVSAGSHILGGLYSFANWC